MYKNILIVLFIFLHLIKSQILQFGKCTEVKTMEYFQIDKFLGKWYVIEEFPVWYEENGHCAYKVFDLCGRELKIQSGFIKRNIQYIVYVNSTYNSGDEAVFKINKSNIDPVGMPLSVISTDYANYSLVYGCRLNENLQLKYISAWILSRSKSLSSELLDQAYRELNSLPSASSAYLQKVNHSDTMCSYQWTAEIHAVDINN